MAKVIITLRKHPRGIHVACSLEGEQDDTQGLQHIAAVVSAGLAGTVNDYGRDSAAVNRSEFYPARKIWRTDQTNLARYVRAYQTYNGR